MDGGSPTPAAHPRVGKKIRAVRSVAAAEGGPARRRARPFPYGRVPGRGTRACWPQRRWSAPREHGSSAANPAVCPACTADHAHRRSRPSLTDRHRGAEISHRIHLPRPLLPPQPPPLTPTATPGPPHRAHKSSSIPPATHAPSRPTSATSRQKQIPPPKSPCASPLSPLLPSSSRSVPTTLAPARDTSQRTNEPAPQSPSAAAAARDRSVSPPPGPVW